MTWTRLSDDFADRREIDGLSDGAFRLHIHALIYCNRMLSDGFLTERDLRRIWLDGDPASLVLELTTARLWTRKDGGYLVDWSEQESSETVKMRRKKNAGYQATYRERNARHGAGDHSLCNENCPVIAEARLANEARGQRSPEQTTKRTAKQMSKGLTKRGGNEAPSLPVPSRGKGREGMDALRLDRLSPSERALVDQAARGFGVETLPEHLRPALAEAIAERERAA